MISRRGCDEELHHLLELYNRKVIRVYFHCKNKKSHVDNRLGRRGFQLSGEWCNSPQLKFTSRNARDRVKYDDFRTEARHVQEHSASSGQSATAVWYSPRGDAMTHQPRFTIRAMLGCTAALCVPLAIMAAGEAFGFVALFPVVGGCVGYLLGGSGGVMTGGFVGLLVWFAIVMAITPP
jgi:hypothetical protein